MSKINFQSAVQANKKTQTTVAQDAARTHILNLNVEIAQITAALPLQKANLEALVAKVSNQARKDYIAALGNVKNPCTSTVIACWEVYQAVQNGKGNPEIEELQAKINNNTARLEVLTEVRSQFPATIEDVAELKFED